MNTRKTALLIAVLASGAAGLVGSLHARTVALWKLDYEPTDTSLNTRCLIDPANDLTACGTVTKGDAVTSWTALPTNPDATPDLLANPTNKNAIAVAPSGAPYTSLTNGSFAAKVNITNSFTIEGWVNRTINPSGSGWFYLFGAHTGGAGRWILSLRNGGTNWILYVDSLIGDKAFPVANDPASTNIWRHLALTYDRDAGSAQQGVWEFFVDGQSCGTITNSSRPATLTTSDSLFSLGGRPTGSNTGNARFDYWRVSDTVLSTNEFLNAGIVLPATEALPRTLAYWRLDSNADGTMDTADYIGTARLSSNLDTTNYTSAIQASPLQAFDGQPPNSAITLTDGNGGSVYAQASGASLRTADLGAQLEVTNNFTVEGWIRPHRQNYDADIQYIANTRISDKGWAFALKKQTDGTRKLVIYAEDNAGVLCGDDLLSGDLSDWADTWKHVALVYDATAGDSNQGTWTCYLDGVQQGCATNSHVVSGDSNSLYFHLAGRVGNGNTFAGYLDCWRVSKAALTPNQFLNATDGASSATDVLALWPLNSADGVYLDATDLVGGYDFGTPLTATHKATSNTSQAVSSLSDPDSSAAFQGDPSLNTGSIQFNTPSGTAPRAYLSTTDADLRAFLCFTNSFTIEGWFYRTQNPGSWQLLFAAGSSPSFQTGGVPFNFTYRSNGYVLYVNAGGVLVNDLAFSGTADDGTLNVWRHIALTYDTLIGNGTWSLYIDGMLQGTLENSAAPVTVYFSAVYVGGRPWSANSFNGAIDSVRLTKGVLTPTQFLNATGATPTSAVPHTVAYWKLDRSGTALDSSSQVESRYSFIPDGFAPSGSSEQCRRSVPFPDTSTNFIGDAKANAGSAAFTANYLRVQNLGNRVELDRAFTVEGWMKWNGEADGTPQTLVGTQFDTDYGWRLTLEKSDRSAVFRLYCATPAQTPLLNTCLAYDAASLAGAWHHVALTFTPRRNDTGTWELFVDGKSVATAANLFYPSVLTQNHWFMLGGRTGGTETFSGLLDCWRVSEGALTSDQMLYRVPGGTLITLF